MKANGISSTTSSEELSRPFFDSLYWLNDTVGTGCEPEDERRMKHDAPQVRLRYAGRGAQASQALDIQRVPVLHQYLTDNSLGIANQFAWGELRDPFHAAVRNKTERHLLAKLNQKLAADGCSSLPGKAAKRSMKIGKSHGTRITNHLL
jgi:hypothetical protein